MHHQMPGLNNVIQEKVPPATGAIEGALLLMTAVLIAFACLKLYDEPVRERLGCRFLTRSAR